MQPQHIRLRATLSFKRGGSDKSYTVEIKDNGTGYDVEVAYGHRGATQKVQCKTTSPVVLAARLRPRLSF